MNSREKQVRKYKTTGSFSQVFLLKKKLWTNRESNPDPVHAKDEYYHYTIGPKKSIGY